MARRIRVAGAAPVDAEIRWTVLLKWTRRMLIPACDPPHAKDSEYGRSSSAIADTAHCLKSIADPAVRAEEFEEALVSHRWPFPHAIYTSFLDSAQRFVQRHQ